MAFEAEFRYFVQSVATGRAGAAATGAGTGFAAGVDVVPVTATDA